MALQVMVACYRGSTKECMGSATVGMTSWVSVMSGEHVYDLGKGIVQ